MEQENAFKQIALQKLAAPSGKDALLDLIRWLDLACDGAAPESLQQQTLTRAIVAVGCVLVEKRRSTPVSHTLEAASLYCIEPTEHHFDLYVEAATRSYAFGAGDGCYAIDELGYQACEPGSGCRSGAGSLYQAGIELGMDAAWQAITRELTPWLRGIADPVALRTDAGS